MRYVKSMELSSNNHKYYQASTNQKLSSQSGHSTLKQTNKQTRGLLTATVDCKESKQDCSHIDHTQLDEYCTATDQYIMVRVTNFTTFVQISCNMSIQYSHCCSYEKIYSCEYIITTTIII